MHMSIRHALACQMVMMSTGCATLSEHQCRSADWNVIGLSDGQRGYPPARIRDHQQACVRYQIEPDVAAYESARARGITRYCTVDAGFQEGRKGRGYWNTCPFDSGPPFVAAYRRGYDIYRVLADVDEVNRRIFNVEGLAVAPYLAADHRSAYQSQLFALYALRASLDDLAWRMESARDQRKPAPDYVAPSFP